MIVFNLYFLIFSKLEFNYLTILAQLLNTKISLKKQNYQKFAMLQFSNINLFKFFYFKIFLTEIKPIFFSILVEKKMSLFTIGLMKWFIFFDSTQLNYLFKFIIFSITSYLKKIFSLVTLNYKPLLLLQYFFLNKND